jgi:hypothetical protein
LWLPGGNKAKFNVLSNAAVVEKCYCCEGILFTLHTTYLAHWLNGAAEQIKGTLLQMNNLLSRTKNLFIKSHFWT